MSVTSMSARIAATPGQCPCPHQVEAVMQDTWGHLAPKVREVYTGEILFCYSIHGDITLIDWDFKLDDGTQLDGSPWLMIDMTEQVCDWLEQKSWPRGEIFNYRGTFERLNNGESRWRGEVWDTTTRLSFKGKH